MEPQNGQQPEPQDQTQPAGQPATQDPPPPIDPDAVRLEAFEKELEAEGKAAAEGTGEPSDADKALVPGQGEGQDGQPGGQDPQQGAGQPTVAVPIARLNQQIKNTRKAEAAAAYYKGQFDAMQRLVDAGLIRPTGEPGAGDGGSAGAGTAQPTLTEREVAAMMLQQQLAEKFEAGELGAGEWKKQDQLIERELFEIRQAMVDERRAPQPVTDLTLDERTAQIEQQYPILADLTDAQLTPLAELAKQQMKIEGEPYDPSSPASILHLRELVAAAADRLFGDGQTQQPGNGQPGQPGKPTGTAASAGNTGAAQPGNQPTATQRRGKLALASQQPPSLASLPGTAQNGLDGLTEEKILGMSPEELAALPATVLDRIEQKGFR
jgi:hypothetical protein